MIYSIKLLFSSVSTNSSSPFVEVKISNGRHLSYSLRFFIQSYIERKIFEVRVLCIVSLQSMDELYEQFALIPAGNVVILDWPQVDKEHKGFSKLVQLIDNHPVSFCIFNVGSCCI